MDKLDDLVAFLSLRAGVKKSAISMQSRIEDDLGVTGDDGEDLIVAYGKKFNVDISEFVFDRYFYPEPNLWLNIYSCKIKSLTVSHLLKGICAGRLNDLIINS